MNRAWKYDEEEKNIVIHKRFVNMTPLKLIGASFQWYRKDSCMNKIIDIEYQIERSFRSDLRERNSTILSDFANYMHFELPINILNISMLWFMVNKFFVQTFFVVSVSWMNKIS